MNLPSESPKYPGTRQAMDGNTAVIMCERESTDGAGAYPITPSTQMGEYWAEETAKGHVNVSGQPLIFIEPEGEHAAAAVTAGMSMTGLRATNFSSGQGIAYMHESLYAAAGKRLTYVLNMGCRAITKASLNVHAGHDDYHAVDDSGFFQVFGKGAQDVCDLNIIAHRIAELSLNPGIVAQDGFLTTHLIESLLLPERELIEEYLGHPSDIIDTPTPAQRLLFGEKRRRIPELWDVDNPVTFGSVQNQDAYMQSVAAQRPFFFDHVQKIADQCMEEFYELTGRIYRRILTYRIKDADYLIMGQGSVVCTAEAVADYLRETRGIKVGVVNMVMFRPFPGDLLGQILKGRKGVTVLERTDQPLAEDLPLVREVRATISKCLENGADSDGQTPFPEYATYAMPKDAPPIFSGCYGLGSRDLQPEAIIGAVENMLPDGPKKKFYYLSIDFIHDKPFTPKQDVYQQQIQDGYPGIEKLSVRGSENPNLMPENSITVRMHSVGGWGAITTGKNLAMTLFDLLGFHVKANPKYGSEKKGQPTTYYLSAAPEPIRINCQYFHVDVVLSPDPNVFSHSNPLAGLKKGGVFVIQSDLETAEDVWASIPTRFQQTIIDNDIRVFYLDAFKIAREEASDPELQFRMQGIAFQGAFFAASPVMAAAQLTEETLFEAIEAQLEAKFGTKGKRTVEDNLRVVRRGFDEFKEIENKVLSTGTVQSLRKDPGLPVLIKDIPAGDAPTGDIHRFWEQTGEFYLSGQGDENLTDPFIGMSLIPAATGLFRDMTQIRMEHPEWIPQNCTGCGDCYVVCPDSAIPGLVNSVSEIFDTTIKRVEGQGQQIKLLRKYLGIVEKNLRALIDEAGEEADVQALLTGAITKTIEDAPLERVEKASLEKEFGLFKDAIGDFKFAVTKPYYTVKEDEAKGNGGLMSITINPYACKGCMECVKVCDDDALRTVPESADSVADLRKEWEFWEALPTTSPDFIRIDDLDERIGALETLLLDKQNYMAMVSGDGACPGCGEKTVVHLFVSTVEALMQPRVEKHLADIEVLIGRLEERIRIQLVSNMDLSDSEAISDAIDGSKDKDLTLSTLLSALDEKRAAPPIDTAWLKRVTQLLAKLKRLKWQYTTGPNKRGRSSLGMINATGCTSVWGSTFPYSPYPFPWVSHLFQDSTSVAMGIFEGHMIKMAEGFKAIRMAGLELEGKYNEEKDKDFFTYFDWQQFSDEEFLLCPPVVAVGGDGAMYDIGFQNLSRMMMSGKPIKVLVLDTQVYSNTGGQACTSGFTGQVSDMAQFGSAQKGKEEARKDIALIGMAHRTSYVVQGAISNATHLIEGFIEGLNTRRPALFNIYSPCPPEHGIADDVAYQQSKLAVESRAYPIFRYNPDLGATPSERFDLEGNPAVDELWPTYTLDYLTELGEKESMELRLTFADFALTEARFRKQFRTAPPETWTEEMLPLAEYIELDAEEREDATPFIWAVDRENHLIRVIPAEPVVKATEERRDFWLTLREIAETRDTVDLTAIEENARQLTVKQIASGLKELVVNGNGTDVAALLQQQAPAIMTTVTQAPRTSQAPSEAPAPEAAGPVAATEDASDNGYLAPWIDVEGCTTCDECTNLNSKIFAYNDKKKAYIKDPKGGSYKDIVRAAEKCTAKVIHPGYPEDRSVKGIGKLIKRAEKFM